MGDPDVGPPPRGRKEVKSKDLLDSEHTSQDESISTGSTPRNASVDRVTEPVNEHLPLLQTSESDYEDGDLLDDNRVVAGHDHYQITKSVWYLIILTVSLGGLQIAWSVELSNGSPYLLSLGLSKSLMALVWIAGPLSGTLVQPYVGVRSDNCRISWGKRKPFMLGGAAATIVSLLALAWTREIVSGFLGLFGADREDHGVKVTIIVVAVLFVYILDFAINTVQAAIRAFMVDCAPTHQQEAANAMASRVTGIGNIIGYCFGYINLPKYMWFFGNTQFKVLCVIASIALGTTVGISCIFINERDPREEGPPATDKGGVIAFFKGVFRSMRRLPPQTRKVCEVQFFAWVGWFGFLFYLSTWIAELYVEPIVEANPGMTLPEIDHLFEKGTRIGTFALLIWAIASLTANMVLPFLIAPTYDVPIIASSASITANTDSQGFSQSFTARVDRVLEHLVIPWLTLSRAWTISLVIFALCMFSTLFIRSPTIATIVVGIVGIPWALTIWAPFAIISAEISRRDAIRRAQALNIPSALASDPLGQDDSGDQAGVILGIHNVAIAAPQVIATLGSSVIFRLLQKPRGTPGDISMPVVLATGGVSVLVAAFVASRLGAERPVEGLEAVRGRVPSRQRRESIASVNRRSLSRSMSYTGGLEY